MNKIYRQVEIMRRALESSITAENHEYVNYWTDKLEELIKDKMPSGSGFDNGTQFDFDHSNINKLVFTSSFHHLDDNGYYCGWSDFKVIITPDLICGVSIKVIGKNVVRKYFDSGMKDFIAQTFEECLDKEV